MAETICKRCLPGAVILSLTAAFAWLAGSGAVEACGAGGAPPGVADDGSPDDIASVGARFREWLLDADSPDDSRRLVMAQYAAALHRARQAQQAASAIDFGRPAELYDTRTSGADRRELYALVTQVPPDLSVVYHLRGPRSGDNVYYHDRRTRELVVRALDRLHDRGFRPGMQMPWKAKDGGPTDPPTAIIVDFHLRTAGYALAALLMRDELEAAGKLDRTLQTCEAICTHGEKTGDLSKGKLNADGVRVAVNFILPYALAANDSKRLLHLKRQLDRSMAVESDASDTIKPDGLGFHHLGVYLAGYALFQAGGDLPEGVLARSDTPCLVLMQDELGPVVRLSICNPDFGWRLGQQYAFRHRDRPSDAAAAVPPKTPVRLTLRGAWRLDGLQEEVTLESRGSSTVVRVDCSDARSVEFRVRRREKR